MVAQATPAVQQLTTRLFITIVTLIEVSRVIRVVRLVSISRVVRVVRVVSISRVVRVVRVVRLKLFGLIGFLELEL